MNQNDEIKNYRNYLRASHEVAITGVKEQQQKIQRENSEKKK